MKLDTNKFIKKYGFTLQDFQSTGFNWSDLIEIKDDYEARVQSLKEALEDFMSRFVTCYDSNGLHSSGCRIKDSEHLIAKLIRKRINSKDNRDANFPKYKSITKDNYRYLVTDLIGVKGLLLFREDWRKFHDYISSFFPLKEDVIGKELNAEIFSSMPECCMIEEPKVHLRAGDDTQIYTARIPRYNIDDTKYYRSIHYILKYKNEIIEVQIRTLFDEGWGEVDHFLLYPNNIHNSLLTEYSELMTRLTGMADEMASFFRRCVSVSPQKFQDKASMYRSLNKKSEEKFKAKSKKTSDVPTSCREMCQAILNQ